MEMRINYEDLILNLYLISRIKGRGNLFVAKMLYLYEEDLFKKNMIGARYKMYKDYYGPYNKTIKDNMEALSENKFLNMVPIYLPKYDGVFDLYKKNRNTLQFLKDIEELIQEYSIFFNIFDNIIDEFGNYSAQQLKDYVYSLENTGIQSKKINEYNLLDLVLDPLMVKNPTCVFELEEDWYDTVEVLLNPNILSGLKKGINDAQKGLFTTFKTT